MDEGINQSLHVEHGVKNLGKCYVEIEVLVLKFLRTLYSSCLLVLKLQIIAFLIEVLPYI